MCVIWTSIVVYVYMLVSVAHHSLILLHYLLIKFESHLTFQAGTAVPRSECGSAAPHLISQITCVLDMSYASRIIL